MDTDSGPPTKEELERLYPPLHSWDELKQLIRIGDLSLLKRHPDLQKRYNLWSNEICALHGSIVDYLIKIRLEWKEYNGCPPVLDPPYFTLTTPEQFIKVLPNDWPYRVPIDIEHYVIWSQLPVIHNDLIHPDVRDRIDYDGLYGFTGQDGQVAEVHDSKCELVEQCGSHVHDFVLKNWPETVWECAWFVNPPRIQSVKDLAHIHVFARRKA